MTSTIALRQEAGRHAGALPLETRQSYPIPVPGPRGLRVAFLYCTQCLDPLEGAFLLAPSYRTLVNYDTGKFEGLKAVTPAELGLADEEDQPLGIFRIPEGVTQEMFAAQVERLFQLYDILLPPYAAGRKAVPEEVRRSAAEFQALFPRVAEPPLGPYYQALGKDFFAWLNLVARGR